MVKRKEDITVSYFCSVCNQRYSSGSDALLCENRKPSKFHIPYPDYNSHVNSDWDIGDMLLAYLGHSFYIVKIVGTKQEKHIIYPIIEDLNKNKLDINKFTLKRLSIEKAKMILSWINELSIFVVSLLEIY